MALQRELKYEIIGNILIIRFIGEINFFQHDEFEELISEHSGKYKNLIVDMSAVTYINSSGINILFNISKIADIRIVGSNNSFVSSVLKIVQFEKVIDTYSTLEDAIKSITHKKDSEIQL
jgi:anti-anti-sigma factor